MTRAADSRQKVRGAAQVGRAPAASTAKGTALPTTTSNSARLAMLDVQADGDLVGGSIAERASAAVAGADAPLPHIDRLQAAFGNHDLTGVRAAVGANAVADLDVRGVTVGDRVAFREAPDLRLAAHEAAHVVQQRAGVDLAGGTGRRGDAYERHADAVARRVVAGRSAKPLLDAAPRGSGAGIQFDEGDLDADIYPFTDIEMLPDRATYEARGELLPRTGFTVGSDALISLDDATSGRRVTLFDAPAPRKADLGIFKHPDPIPETYGAGTAEMTIEHIVVRLAALEVATARLGKYVPRSSRSLSDVAVWELGHVSRQLRFDGDPMWFDLSLGDPSQGVSPIPPISREPRLLSPEVVRTELVIDRVETNLAELATQREQESAIGAGIEANSKGRPDATYDAAESLVELDNVRDTYLWTLAYILRPKMISVFDEADRMHGEATESLIRRKVNYYQRVSSKVDQPRVKRTINNIHNWAGRIEEHLDWLEEQAPKLRAARDANVPDIHTLEAEFTRRAALVALSIEALGEYDTASQAYEILVSSIAFTGQTDARQIVWRLEQLYEAAMDGDVEYLQLLLRDHRADPKINAFYQSIPSILRWSALIVTLAILLISTLAVAGVTFAFAAITGLSLQGLTLGARFALYALQAVTFTIVQRQLSSAVGMEPMSSFWWDLLWNFALFAGMGELMRGLGPLFETMTKFEAFAVSRAIAFNVLQIYGLLRGSIEAGHLLTPDQILEMTVDNLVLMVGMEVGMKFFEPALEGIGKRIELARFHKKYGSSFEGIEARRKVLANKTQERLRANPQATEADISDLRAEAEAINADLAALVEQVKTDPGIKLAEVRAEAAEALGKIDRIPLPEQLRNAGFAATFDIVPTGRPGVFTFPRGETKALRAALEKAGYEIVGESDTAAGKVIEAEIPGRGVIELVESPVEGRIVAPAGEAELAAAREHIAQDKAAGGTRGGGAYTLAEKPQQTNKTVAAATEGLSKGLAAEGIKLGPVVDGGKTVTTSMTIDIGGKPVEVAVTIEVVPDLSAPRIDLFSVHGRDAGHAHYTLSTDAKGHQVAIEIDARLANEADVQHHLRHELREARGIIEDLARDPNLDVAAEQQARVFRPGEETAPSRHDRTQAAELRDLFDELKPALDAYEAARKKLAMHRGTAEMRAARAAGEDAQRRLDAALDDMGFTDPKTRAAKIKALLDMLGADSPVASYVQEYSERTEANVERRAALDRVPSGDRAVLGTALGPELADHLANRVPAGAIDPLVEAVKRGRAEFAKEMVRQHSAGNLTDVQLVDATHDLATIDDPATKPRGKPRPPGFEKPSGKKPKRGTVEGTDYRYQRYKSDWWFKGEDRTPLMTAEEYADANLRGGRHGGWKQRATRAKLVKLGYTDTELGTSRTNRKTVVLGTREEDGRTVRNEVDMTGFGKARGGGMRYVEVDPMTNAGFPENLRAKLKAELAALKPGEDLLFVDSNDVNRQIVYEYGEDPSVVDSRSCPLVLPRRPRGKSR